MPLFPWCTSPYSKSIHRFYKVEERSQIKIKFQSPQLSKNRTSMVDWICRVADKIHMFKATVHLSVYIMDLFMDTHNINEDKLGIVALVCLIIAEKYEGDEGQPPNFRMLFKELSPTFAIPDKIQSLVIKLERLILGCLHWRLGWITVAHFSEYYRLFAVINGDCGSSNATQKELLEVVQYSFDRFLNRCLFHVQLINTLPSSKAAASLLAARIENNVSPVWPDILSRITWFHFDQISTVANFLLTNGQYDAESGYSSSPETLGKLFDSSATP